MDVGLPTALVLPGAPRSTYPASDPSDRLNLAFGVRKHPAIAVPHQSLVYVGPQDHLNAHGTFEPASASGPVRDVAIDLHGRRVGLVGRRGGQATDSQCDQSTRASAQGEWLKIGSSAPPNWPENWSS